MKIWKRGQVTIPKQLREQYGLEKGVEVEFFAEGGGIRIRKRCPVDRVRGIIKLQFAGSVDEYIEEIRGR